MLVTDFSVAEEASPAGEAEVAELAGVTETLAPCWRRWRENASVDGMAARRW